ncbi:hypothetical protein [Acidovorax sp. Leaf160]|uniref:hypothetical protein n=1 Tax=Acidovorax sp. Leaf160 TaxID=1736280 RepID=UPI0006F74CC1|nr:hypothetical protein [Acidovorax sp. Leaf160]KQR55534.1 hypothetical protein ASF94_03715 [Acidovorax sp. Leaf160]
MSSDPQDHPVVQPVPEGLPRPPSAVPVGTDEQPGQDRQPSGKAMPAPTLDTAQEWSDKPVLDVLGEDPKP